jgi:hypothetical protein
MSTTLEAPEVLRESAPADARFNYAAETKKFRSRFIEPGLVSYRDMPGGGIELLRKETIDRCLQTALNNPLTIGHTLVTPENRIDVENGVVTGVDYSPEDAWYYAIGTAETEAAVAKIKAGWRPSCAYTVLDFGPGGSYHGIKYDREITDIVFNHLAIVEKPRYEDATFRLNSLANTMNVFKFLKKLVTRENGAETTRVEASELNLNTLIDVDGKKVRLNNLVGAWLEKTGACFNAADDDEVEVDGKPVKMNELKAAYRSMSAPVKEEEVKENSAPAAPVIEPVLKTNAAEPVIEAKATNEAPKPAASLTPVGLQNFQTLANARNNVAPLDGGYSTTSGSLRDKVARGKERY